jgi:hypothetical protein
LLSFRNADDFQAFRTIKTQPETQMATKKSASKKAGARKSVTANKKNTNRKNSAKKKFAQTASPNNKDRYDQIQERAYYIAEEDGFKGDPTHYWLEARKQLGVES